MTNLKRTTSPADPGATRRTHTRNQRDRIVRTYTHRLAIATIAYVDEPKTPAPSTVCVHGLPSLLPASGVTWYSTHINHQEIVWDYWVMVCETQPCTNTSHSIRRWRWPNQHTHIYWAMVCVRTKRCRRHITPNNTIFPNAWTNETLGHSHSHRRKTTHQVTHFQFNTNFIHLRTIRFKNADRTQFQPSKNHKICNTFFIYSKRIAFIQFFCSIFFWLI